MDSIRTLKLGAWEVLVARDREAQARLFSQSGPKDFLFRFQGGEPDCIGVLRADELFKMPRAMLRKAGEAIAWDCKLPPDKSFRFEWCQIGNAAMDPGDPPSAIRAVEWRQVTVQPRPPAESSQKENW